MIMSMELLLFLLMRIPFYSLFINILPVLQIHFLCDSKITSPLRFLCTNHLVTVIQCVNFYITYYLIIYISNYLIIITFVCLCVFLFHDVFSYQLNDKQFVGKQPVLYFSHTQ